MTAAAQQTTQKAHGEFDALLTALAKANGHPDPRAYVAEVRKHLEDK